MIAKQPDRPQWLTDHRREVAAMANRFSAEMAGCTIDMLRTVVADNDVAYAVWNDRASPDGISILAIKGQQAMRDIVASGEARALSITAFPCRGEIEAGALQEMIGEADRRH